MQPARKVSFRHFLMDDAAARRHPLNVAGRDGTAVAHAIAVLNSYRQDIRDGFDPAMRVPREPSQIILGNVVAEIVQEKEWIEVGCIAESESAAKMHASAFERRLGLDELLNGSNGHFGLLDAKLSSDFRRREIHCPSDRASLALIALSRLTTQTMPRALGSNRALRITSCSRGLGDRGAGNGHPSVSCVFSLVPAMEFAISPAAGQRCRSKFAG